MRLVHRDRGAHDPKGSLTACAFAEGEGGVGELHEGDHERQSPWTPMFPECYKHNGTTAERDRWICDHVSGLCFSVLRAAGTIYSASDILYIYTRACAASSHDESLRVASRFDEHYNCVNR